MWATVDAQHRANGRLPTAGIGGSQFTSRASVRLSTLLGNARAHPLHATTVS